MRKWTKLVTSGVALLSVATLAACSSGGDKADTGKSGEVTLKLWVPTESKKSYADTIAEFEKENEGVKVEVVESEDPKAQELVSKDPEAAADVFSMPHDQLGGLVESGIIQPVSDQYASEIAENNVEKRCCRCAIQG